MRLLLEAGANKDAKDNYGNTPLFVAAMNGHEAVVRLLLEAGADKEAKSKGGFFNNGKTALDLAREKGHTSIVAVLGGSAADKEAAEKVAAEKVAWMAGSELYSAARDGKTEEVRRLLAKKAPLEWNHVRHRPYRKSTTRRPAHAGALCGKRRCGEGLRGGAARARGRLLVTGHLQPDGPVARPVEVDEHHALPLPEDDAAAAHRDALGAA